MADDQRSMSFQDAKEAVVDRLNFLADLAESADQHLWAASLRDVAVKTSRSTAPKTMPERDFQQAAEFTNTLIKMGGPKLEPKLRSFWDLHAEIAQLLMGPSPPAAGYQPYGHLESAIRLAQTDAMSRHTFESLRKDPAAHHVPAALLYVLLARAEDIEYFQVKTAENAVKAFGLGGKYDPAEMCSVRGKINNTKNGDQTDIRAYRNCAGHKGVKINYHSGSGWDIEFESHARGYNFHHKLSQDDFMRFSDGYTRLYKLQIALIRIQELLAIMATHLVKASP